MTQANPTLFSSTYQSTVFLTTTDDHGSTTLSAPSAFTSILVSTNSLGEPMTITQIINNPTLIPNGSQDGTPAYVRSVTRPRFLLTLAVHLCQVSSRIKGQLLASLCSWESLGLRSCLVSCFGFAEEERTAGSTTIRRSRRLLPSMDMGDKTSSGRMMITL